MHVPLLCCISYVHTYIVIKIQQVFQTYDILVTVIIILLCIIWLKFIFMSYNYIVASLVASYIATLFTRYVAM